MHYELHDLVGVGGMGTVYRAVDLRAGREVAVKVLDAQHDPAKDPISRERFQREARLSMRLSHSNIVEVLDAGEYDGVSFIVMELLRGQTLYQLLETEKALPTARALFLFREMCAGLAFAHELGLVHRDLKPANVMVLRDEETGREQVKLLDFGLAKPFLATPSSDDEVTRNNLVMGSPTYMAPEQARGEAGIEGDIYSLGVVLFRMLTGRVPFSGRSGIDVIVQHVQAPVPHFAEIAPDARVSGSLELVVRRCLEKLPQNRYPSVKALLAALVEAENSPSSPMPPPRLTSSSGMAAVRTPTRPQLEVIDDVVQPPKPALSPNVELFASQQPKAASAFGWLWVVLGFIAVGGAAWVLGRSTAGEQPAPAATAAVKPGGATSPAAPNTATEPNAKPAEGAGATATPTATAAAEPVPTVTPKGPVTFRINSIPIGATVKLGGKPMGLTPVAFEVPADENGEATAELTLELRGYQALTFIATSSGPRFDLVQRLRKGTGRVQLAPVHPEPTVAPKEVAAPVVSAAIPAPVASLPRQSRRCLREARRGGGRAHGRANHGGRRSSERSGGTVVAESAWSTSRRRCRGLRAPRTSFSPAAVGERRAALRYPREAVAARVEGTSVARCRVTVAGALTDCHITKSVPMLDDAVMQSLTTRQYEPAKVGANAVETEISIVTRLTAR